MSKTLDTLVEDIHKVLSEGVEVSKEIAENFGEEMKNLLTSRLKKGERKPTLRMSSIGKPDRQLWFEINQPDKAEKLHPNAHLKFLIGDIIESITLTLAEISGHRVEGKQSKMKLAGIVGHRDAVIDGVTCDVKSASPFSFKKFEGGLTHDKDSFGYITQLNSYIHAGQEDDLVQHKDHGAFIAIQKVTGDMVVDVHKKADVPLEEIFEHKKKIVSLPEPPEEKCYQPEPMGKSGNMKLNVNCSYCSHKWNCWDNLRAFHYSTGPVFLVEIMNEPKVPEFDVNGNIINKDGG